MIAKIIDGDKVINESKPLEFTYDDLMNLELKLVDASSTYKYNNKYDIYESMTENNEFMNNVYNNATQLKIVGIACPQGNSATAMSGIGYTRKLTEHVINTASESEIVKKQLANKDVNVFSGKRFDDKNTDTGLDFQDMISIDEELLSSAFGTKIDEKQISSMTQGYIGEISSAITADTSKAQEAYNITLTTIMKDLLNKYIEENQVAGMAVIKQSDVEKVVDDFMVLDTTKAKLAKLEAEYIIPQNTFAEMYSKLIKGALNQYIVLMSTTPSVPPTSSPSEPGEGEEITTEIPDMGAMMPEFTEPSAILVSTAVDQLVDTFIKQEMIQKTAQAIGTKMVEATMQKTILTKVGELTSKLMGTMASAFNVDTDKIAAAFKFEMSEEEMRRLFETMTTTTVENADTNLLTLGYKNLEEPTSISFYFKDFDSKESFKTFIDDYNEGMIDEDKVIKYTDLTGILMSSVKTIVDSVSYVLIAFVSISLIVSSIMIGIITYISVLERTKEIGVLRAIGASKRNISSIFNAETFIVGLFSGALGILTTLGLLIPTNAIIHSINTDITAVLPMKAAIILVILSVILTLIGGLIPSRQAAKKDPVLALRSE